MNFPNVIIAKVIISLCEAKLQSANKNSEDKRDHMKIQTVRETHPGFSDLLAS